MEETEIEEGLLSSVMDEMIEGIGCVDDGCEGLRRWRDGRGLVKGCLEKSLKKLGKIIFARYSLMCRWWVDERNV